MDTNRRAPIVEQATFEAVQAQLARNKVQATRNRKYDYLLINGRLRCGQCGKAMHGTMGGKDDPQYRCPQPRYQDIVAPHTRRSVQVRALEPMVWEQIEGILSDPDRIAAELERRKAGTSTQQADLDRERQQYTRQLAQCDRELQRAWDAYQAEVIDLAFYKT